MTTPHLYFFIGIATLWLYSAAVGAMEEPTAASSPFYKWLYKFLKTVAGDLKTVFSKYMPARTDNSFNQPLTARKLNAEEIAAQFAAQGQGQQPSGTKLSMVLVCLCAAAIVCGGCAHQVAAPLPQGAINSVDAQTNAILQAGHAAAAQYELDVKQGFQPSPAFKAAVAQLVTALNVADPLYQTWHTVLVIDPTAGEPAALSSAVTQVSGSLTNVTSAAK